MSSVRDKTDAINVYLIAITWVRLQENVLYVQMLLQDVILAKMVIHVQAVLRINFTSNQASAFSAILWINASSVQVKITAQSALKITIPI